MWQEFLRSDLVTFVTKMNSWGNTRTEIQKRKEESRLRTNKNWAVLKMGIYAILHRCQIMIVIDSVLLCRPEVLRVKLNQPTLHCHPLE